jgi:hypothetical protein
VRFKAGLSGRDHEGDQHHTKPHSGPLVPIGPMAAPRCPIDLGIPICPMDPEGGKQRERWSSTFVADLVWRAIAGSIPTCQASCGGDLGPSIYLRTHLPEGTQGARVRRAVVNH